MWRSRIVIWYFYHENFSLLLKDNGDYIDPVRGNLVGRESILDRDAVKIFHASYISKGAKMQRLLSFIIEEFVYRLCRCTIPSRRVQNQEMLVMQRVFRMIYIQLKIARLYNLRKWMLTSSLYWKQSVQLDCIHTTLWISIRRTCRTIIWSYNTHK